MSAGAEGRLVPLEGASNFRDLGGYRTADGRRVRPGRVFRSDALHRLTDGDHRVLRRLGLRVVLDLRYGPEREREPDRLPDGEPPIESLHIGLSERPDPAFADSLDGSARDAASALAHLTRNYREYPGRYAGAYRALLERASWGAPLVFHCTAGKDRAGFAAAVLLLALGVGRETVLVDYLKTNAFWDRGDRVPEGWPSPVVEAVFTARAEYLEAAMDEVDASYGGFDAYLEREIGFGDERRSALRSALLD